MREVGGMAWANSPLLYFSQNQDSIFPQILNGPSFLEKTKQESAHGSVLTQKVV